MSGGGGSGATLVLYELGQIMCMRVNLVETLYKVPLEPWASASRRGRARKSMARSARGPGDASI